MQSRKLWYYALPVILFAAVCAIQPTLASAEGIDCSRAVESRWYMQDNLGVGHMMIACGLAYGGHASGGSSEAEAATTPPNVRASNRSCTSSQNCTKSESMVTGSTKNSGKTIVVNYNDHNINYGGSGLGTFGGLSYSTDSGATFTEIQPPPFATGHGDNLGDPIVIYNAKLATWFAGDLVGSLTQNSDCTTGSGELGIGLWTSTDGKTWKTGACPHVGVSDDRESFWVDNSPNSAVYGRMYISWNDFGNNAALSLVYSDDGTTWKGPVILANGSTFIRDVQVTGGKSSGANSTVFVVGMDEGGGGNATRQNLVYISTNGGTSFKQVTMGARFNPVGDQTCSSEPYFYQVNPIIRHMGWGEPAVGPNGVIHYVFAGAGTNGDHGDIFYTRSTNNGNTWSKAVKLNTDKDGPNKTQWMPSLSVNGKGVVTASWYDRSQATSACNNVGDPGCNYNRIGIQSTDNGVTWGSEITISSSLVTQPAQDDPDVVSCYAGDYDYNTAIAGNAYVTWTDGRRKVGGVPVQDVEFAPVPTR
ncbi:MAG TPA: sialidase family protein [Terriglobales bacterium]